MSATQDIVVLYRPDELAAAWSVPLATVRGWIYRGELGSVKLGHHRRITPNQAARFLEAHGDLPQVGSGQRKTA